MQPAYLLSVLTAYRARELEPWGKWQAGKAWLARATLGLVRWESGWVVGLELGSSPLSPAILSVISMWYLCFSLIHNRCDNGVWSSLHSFLAFRPFDSLHQLLRPASAW